MITQKYMIMFIIYVQYIINCLGKISTMISIEYQYLSLNTSTSTWKRYLSTAQVPVQVPSTQYYNPVKPSQRASERVINVWNDMPADTVDFTSSSSSSSSSFYLPDNTTVCTSTSIQFRRAGQQGQTRTLTAALYLLLIFRNPLCVLILLHTWSVCPEAKQARGGAKRPEQRYFITSKHRTKYRYNKVCWMCHK